MSHHTVESIENERLIGLREAAAMLGCSKFNAWRLVHAGRITGYRILPRRISVSTRSILAYIDSSLIVPKQPKAEDE